MARAGNIHRASAIPNAGTRPILRILLTLTTSPWQPPAGLGRGLADYLGNLELSGWTLRQALLRNYLLWRNAKQRSLAKPILLLPRFAERAPQGAVTVLVLADIMAAERRTTRRPWPAGLLERQRALALAEAGLEPVELAELAEAHLVTAVARNWLL